MASAGGEPPHPTPSFGEQWPALHTWHHYMYAARLARGARALDLKCGGGRGAYLLAGAAQYVVATDSDIGAIRRAAVCYPRANLTYRTTPLTDLPSHTFDLAVALQTDPLLASEEDCRRLVLQARDLLRQDGIVLISMAGDPTRPIELLQFTSWLREIFDAVHLLAQRLYAGSYMWSMEGAASDFYEMQVDWTPRGYGPSDEPRRARSILALCSGSATATTAASLLIDVSDRLLRKPDAAFGADTYTEHRQATTLSITALKAELAGTRRRLSDLLIDCERLERELRDIRRHSEECDLAVSRAAARSAELTGQLETLQAANATAEAHAQSAQQRLERAIADSQDLAERLNLLSIERNATVHRLMCVQANAASQETDLAQARARLREVDNSVIWAMGQRWIAFRRRYLDRLSVARWLLRHVRQIVVGSRSK